MASSCELLQALQAANLQLLSKMRLHVKQASADNAVCCALCAVKTDTYLKHISLTSGELVFGGSKALPVWAPSLHLRAVYLIACRA